MSELRTLKIAVQLLLMLLVVFHGSCRNRKNEQVVVPPAPPAPTINPNPVMEEQKMLVASYEKTACFGTCPIFRFELFSDGTALYHGVNFVNMIGNYEAKLSDATLDQIRREAESIHFYEMKDLYDEPHVTDLPSVITGVIKNGQMKVVTARRGSPAELKNLYALFDEIIQNAKWTIKTEKENKH